MVWRQTIKDEMSRIQRQMDRLFSNFWNTSENKTNFLDKIPLDYRKAKADFIETENEFILEVELPGIEKEDIKLNVTDRGIELKAEKKEEKGEKTKESYSYAKSYAGFYRSIDLPIEADKENMDASYKNGILTVHIPIKKNIKQKKEVKIK